MGEPTSREISWIGEVLRVDPDRYTPDTAYEFTGGRKFYSTDSSEHGFYNDSAFPFDFENEVLG